MYMNRIKNCALKSVNDICLCMCKASEHQDIFLRLGLDDILIHGTLSKCY